MAVSLISTGVQFPDASRQTTAVVGTSSKAWVNFNGIGTVSIRASGNVSSITDNGVGDYTVNFTSAMADANYALVGTTQGIAGLLSINNTTGLLAGSARIMVTNSTTAGPADIGQACVSIFR